MAYAIADPVGAAGRREETIARLEWASTVDRLTGCLNRYALIDRLTGLNLAGSSPLLVVQVNISGFSAINNAFGQEAGDAILLQVARRLEDLQAHALGKIGSDEFVVAFTLADAAEAASKLSTVEQKLQPRFRLREDELSAIRVRFAIGYVVAHRGDEGLALLRKAGTAVARAKGQGLRQVSEFDAEASRVAAARVRLAEDLQRAVGRHEFKYFYQPKVDLQTRAVVGAEALLRWEHPKLGLLGPDQFMTIAHETEVIVDISTNGFRKVASLAKRVNRHRPMFLNIAMNVSAQGLQYGGLPDLFHKVVRTLGVDPGWMTIELTEDVMADSTPELKAAFESLRRLGFGLAIDDFGTGYSSLRYLKDFPITEIKIDRSFVDGLTGDRAKQFVAEAIIKLGDALGLEVVAEGIETMDQSTLLEELGCKRGQGYLFGRPMEEAAFLNLVGAV